MLIQNYYSEFMKYIVIYYLAFKSDGWGEENN